MNIDLPFTGNMPANVLAQKFTKEELSEAIAYLELVLKGIWHPGPEMFRLGINPIGQDYSLDEVGAVQRRLARAIVAMSNS